MVDEYPTSDSPAFEGFFAFFSVCAFACLVCHRGWVFAVCAGHFGFEDGTREMLLVFIVGLFLYNNLSPVA